MQIEYKQEAGESYNDFFVRVGMDVLSHNLTWKMAAEILNNETGNSFDESTYRKRFTAFYEGMMYANGKKNKDSVRILSISDLHIPYQKPVSTFSDYAGNIDILQLNGDIVDCQAISRFPKTYRKSPMDEIVVARQYLIDLITMLKPKKVVANYGNHDLRFQNYFAKNLDSDLLELMPRTSLELIFVDGFTRYNKELHTKVHYDPLKEVFSDIDIEYIDNWFVQIGDTIFCHPSSFTPGIMATGEKARRYFKDEGYKFTSLVMAHTHRIGHYVVGDTIVYEQGAACNTKGMHYSDGRLVRSQKEGFAYIVQDNSTGKVDEQRTHVVRLN